MSLCQVNKSINCCSQLQSNSTKWRGCSRGSFGAFASSEVPFERIHVSAYLLAFMCWAYSGLQGTSPSAKARELRAEHPHANAHSLGRRERPLLTISDPWASPRGRSCT